MQVKIPTAAFMIQFSNNDLGKVAEDGPYIHTETQIVLLAPSLDLAQHRALQPSGEMDGKSVSFCNSLKYVHLFQKRKKKTLSVSDSNQCLNNGQRGKEN